MPVITRRFCSPLTPLPLSVTAEFSDSGVTSRSCFSLERSDTTTRLVAAFARPNVYICSPDNGTSSLGNACDGVNTVVVSAGAVSASRSFMAATKLCSNGETARTIKPAFGLLIT